MLTFVIFMIDLIGSHENFLINASTAKVIQISRLQSKKENFSVPCEIPLQCLQAALLSFSINFPIFQYFAYIFSIFQRAPCIHDVCTKILPVFSIFEILSVFMVRIQ